MFKTFIDFFKNKDIRRKIFFTLFILFIFRLGASIPAPGVNTTVIKLSANSLLTMMSILGGGSIEQMSILSLGVGPYITASIIIELLAMDIIPALAEMAKSGKKGRQQMDVIRAPSAPSSRDPRRAPRAPGRRSASPVRSAPRPAHQSPGASAPAQGSPARAHP